MKQKQHDNKGGRDKRQIRRLALKITQTPIAALETHAGKGQIYQALYTELPPGVAIEQNPTKAAVLAKQRPHWLVYQADSTKFLAQGIPTPNPINYADIDPYGDPWPTIRALLSGETQKADEITIVVNDGLRQRARLGNLHEVNTLKDAALKFGMRNVDHFYLAVCEYLAQKEARDAGYDVARFDGFYAGSNRQMTHYVMRLHRQRSAKPPTHDDPFA